MEIRLEILNRLRDNRSLSIKDLEDLDVPLVDLHSILENMTAEAFISRGPDRSGPYRITDRGREYRLQLQAREDRTQQELQQQADKAAKEDERHRSERAQAVEDKKQEFRHDYAVAAFSAVSGALVTLVFEYICGHAGLLEEFFRFLLGW